MHYVFNPPIKWVLNSRVRARHKAFSLFKKPNNHRHHSVAFGTAGGTRYTCVINPERSYNNLTHASVLIFSSHANARPLAYSEPAFSFSLPTLIVVDDSVLISSFSIHCFHDERWVTHCERKNGNDSSVFSSSRISVCILRTNIEDGFL